MKKLIFSLILILSSFFLFAQEVIDLNGNNWNSWNMTQKFSFVNGFMTGSFAAIQMALNTGVISSRELSKIYAFLVTNTTTVQVILEIDRFYQNVSLDWPLAIAVFIRKDYEKIRGVSWSSVQNKEIYNWEGTR